MNSRIVNCILFLIATAACGVRADAIQVNQWLLTAAINDFNQVPTQSLSFFNVLANPFVNSHSANLGGASSIASYSFNWSNSSADFQAACSFVGTGYPNADASLQRVGCDGKIYITPSIDALLSVQAHMDYALGPGDRESSGGWSVAQLPSPAPIAFGGFHAQPAFGDPPVASWNHQGSLTLLAGQQYLLRYGFGVDSYPGSGTQSQLSTGNASVLFHIDALPEPAALSPLAFAALLTCRPKKKRSC